MKVLFLIIESEKNKIDIETEKSILDLKLDYELVTLKDKKDLYFSIKTSSIIKEYDFVFILQNGSLVSQNFHNIFNEFVDNKEILYLPLVILSNENVKGVLNTSLYGNEVIEYGILDHDYALHQVNTTLYGALIPSHLFLEESNYNKEIELYQHFYFLNKISHKDIVIQGIPKILLELKYDLSFEKYNKEDKLKWFKECRIEFLKEENLETVNQ